MSQVSKLIAIFTKSDSHAKKRVTKSRLTHSVTDCDTEHAEPEPEHGKDKGTLRKDDVNIRQNYKRCGSFTTEDLDLFPSSRIGLLYEDKPDDMMDVSDRRQTADRNMSLHRKNSKSEENIPSKFNKPKPPQKPKLKAKPPPKPVKPFLKHVVQNEGLSTSGTNSDVSEDEKVKETRKELATQIKLKKCDEKNENVKENNSSSPENAMVKQDSLDTEGMGNINSDGSVDSWLAEDDRGGSGKATSWVNDTMSEIAKRLDGDKVNESPAPVPRQRAKPTNLTKDSPPPRPKGSPSLKARNTPPPRPSQPPKLNDRSKSLKQGGANIPNNGSGHNSPPGDRSNSANISKEGLSNRGVPNKVLRNSPQNSRKSPSGNEEIFKNSSPNGTGDRSQSNSPKILESRPNFSPKRVRKKPTVPPPDVPKKHNDVTVIDSADSSPNMTPNVTDSEKEEKSAKPSVAPKPRPRTSLARNLSPEIMDTKVSPFTSDDDSPVKAERNVSHSDERKSPDPDNKLGELNKSHVITKNNEVTETLEASKVMPQDTMPIIPVRKKRNGSKITTDGSFDKDMGQDNLITHDQKESDKTDNCHVNCDITHFDSSAKHKSEHIYEEVVDKNKNVRNTDKKVNAPVSPGVGIPHSHSLPRGYGDMSAYALAEGDPTKFGVKSRKSSNKEEYIYEEISKRSTGSNSVATRSASHSAADNVKRPQKPEKEKTGIFKKFMNRGKGKSRERNKTDPGISSSKSGRTQFFVQIEHTHLNSNVKGSEESIDTNSAKDSGLASDTEGNLANLESLSKETTDESNASTSTTDSIPELPEKEPMDERNRGNKMEEAVYMNVEMGRDIYGDIEIKKNQAGRNDLISDSTKSSTLLTMSSLTDADDEGEFTESSEDEERGQESPKDTEPVEPIKNKLQKVANELLETEKAYVNKLHLVDQVFQMGIVLENRSNNMFPDEEIPKMFSNIKSIYQFHSNFLLPQLEKRMQEWEENQKICDIMRKFAPFLKMYTQYVADFDTAMEKINFWTNKSPNFSNFLHKLQKKPECGSLALQHHMLEPIQRVPRYELLLKDYKKHLPENSDDKKDSEIALDLVAKASSHTNDALRNIEQFRKLLDLNDMFGGTFDIVSPTRTLVKEGRITKISARNGEHLDRYLFVFNDLLLLCSHQSLGLTSSYKVKAKLDLDGMHINEGHNLMTPNTFLVKSKSKAVEFHCKSDEEKIEWLMALWNVVRDYTKKKLTRMETNKITDTFAEEELGKRAPQWVKDHETSMCMNPSCATGFTLVRRRHHCRACGIVICGECSSMKAPLAYDNDKENRVCDNCYTILMGREVSKISKNSAKPKVLQVNAVEKSIVSGYLHMSTDKKSWQKRWFSIRKDLVMYSYKANQDVCAMTSLPLPGYEVQFAVIEEGLDKPFVFKLTHMGSRSGTYYFQAENKDTMDKWTRVLEKVVLAELPEECEEEGDPADSPGERLSDRISNPSPT